MWRKQIQVCIRQDADVGEEADLGLHARGTQMRRKQVSAVVIGEMGAGS